MTFKKKKRKEAPIRSVGNEYDCVVLYNTYIVVRIIDSVEVME